MHCDGLEMFMAGQEADRLYTAQTQDNGLAKVDEEQQDLRPDHRAI